MQIHKDKQMQHSTGNGLQRPTSDSDYFILDRASFNQGINAKYKMTISRGGVYADFSCERTPCGCGKKEVIGFDSYNINPTWSISITLQSSRADDHHLPVVFIRRNNEETSSLHSQD